MTDTTPPVPDPDPVDPDDAGDDHEVPGDLVEAYEAVEYGMAVDRAALEAAEPTSLTGDAAPRDVDTEAITPDPEEG